MACLGGRSNQYSGMSDQAAPRALYFDSNVLRKWGWPDPSARLLEIIAKGSSVGVSPAMVELVQQELTEGWIRDTFQARRSLVDKIREYSRRAQGLGETAEPPPLPTRDQMREHLAKVTAKFSTLFRAVQTSKQPAEYYMKLAMSRGGAFVEGGRGFNDTVILVSIVEDMAVQGVDSAILVSEDQGFQNDGIKQVTAGKQLQVVRSIEQLDKIFDDLLSAKVHAYLRERKEKLIAAVKSQEDELVAFLRQNLSLTTEDFGLVDQVRKVDFREILSYEDAHSAPFIFGQDSREENRLSIDVRIRVHVETESILFERRRERLDASPFSLHPEDILISSSDKEIVVTVEGASEVAEDGIKMVRFSTVRSKAKERGPGDLLLQ